MKFTIKTALLLPLLENAKTFSSDMFSRIFLGMRFPGEVVVESTDGYIHTEQHTRGPSSLEGGECVVDGRKLLGILSGFAEEEASLETKDGKLTIKVGRSRFTLPFLPPEHFPRFTNIEGGPSARFGLGAKALLRAISRTMIGSGESLNRGHDGKCINLQSHGESWAFAATDDKKLSVVTIRSGLAFDGTRNDPFSICIPNHWIQGAKRILQKERESVSLIITDHGVTLQTANLNFSGGLIEQEFPAYGSVLPDKTYLTTAFNRDDLEPSLRRLMTLTDRTSRRVDLDIMPQTMGLKVNGTDLAEGHDWIPVEHEGKPTALSLNGFFLLEYLEEVPPGARIEMLVKSPLAPVGLNVEGETDWQYIVMPLA